MHLPALLFVALTIFFAVFALSFLAMHYLALSLA
jgi:hypothetical protein